MDRTSNHLHIPKLIKYMSHFLSEIVKGNSDINYDDKDPFSTKGVPSVSIHYYIERLMKYVKAETSTLIIMLIYADLLCVKSKMSLYPHNIHRILLACFVLAIKYNEDDYYENAFYAKVGGVQMKEMNILEYQCIKLLDFEFFINEDIFNKYLSYLKSYSIAD